MTTLESMLTQPIVWSIGWALVHFVWQGAVVAVALAIGLRLLRGATAGVRYGIACSALLLMASLPLITVWRMPATASGGNGSLGMAPTRPGQTSATKPLIEPPATDSGVDRVVLATKGGDSNQPWHYGLATRVEVYLPWMVLAWLLGVLVISLRLFGGWVQVRRVQRVQVRPLEETWQSRLVALGRRMGINRPVRLLESCLATVPITVGWLRPVVLLPTSALLGLTPSQLEAICAHELAHIRRHDYLVNLFQTAIETVLFYHPAVWWVSHRIRLEREYCCDDLAVRVCGDRIVYARALTALDQLRSAPASFVLAATGGSLLTRIRRLVARPSPRANGVAWCLTSTIALTIVGGRALGIHVAASGQEKPTPQAPPATGAGDESQPAEQPSGKVTLQERASLITGHPPGIIRLAFSPDGKTLATASQRTAEDGGTAKLWDVATGQERATLEPRLGAIWTSAFSPDGRTFATGGGTWNEIGGVKLWDVATGQELATLQQAPNPILCLAFSPDGTILATGTGDDRYEFRDGQGFILPGPRGGWVTL